MLKNKVIEQLKTVYDPEMPVDIYELGLIYDISFEEVSPSWNPLKKSAGKNCKILMTLTVEVYVVKFLPSFYLLLLASLHNQVILHMYDLLVF